MTAALKSFILSLSSHLELTPAALYERQRALVRAGLLTTDGSRGPGGGVRATPTTVSLLLISAMASESLSTAAALAEELADLKALTHSDSPFVSDKFYECVAEIFAVNSILNRVKQVRVNRTDCSARILWVNEDIESETFFPNRNKGGGRILVEASISHELLAKIAVDLRFLQEDDE